MVVVLVDRSFGHFIFHKLISFYLTHILPNNYLKKCYKIAKQTQSTVIIYNKSKYLYERPRFKVYCNKTEHTESVPDTCFVNKT